MGSRPIFWKVFKFSIYPYFSRLNRITLSRLKKNKEKYRKIENNFFWLLVWILMGSWPIFWKTLKFSLAIFLSTWLNNIKSVKKSKEKYRKIENSYFRYMCEKVILSSWRRLRPSEPRVKRPHEDKITFSLAYWTQFFHTTCAKLDLAHAVLLERPQSVTLRTECENNFFWLWVWILLRSRPIFWKVLKFPIYPYFCRLNRTKLSRLKKNHCQYIDT